MKVGDLVKCLTVDGKPLGLVVEVNNHTSGYRILHYRVLVKGGQWDFLSHHLEVANACR